MDLTMIIFSLYFVKILKISSWTIHWSIITRCDIHRIGEDMENFIRGDSCDDLHYDYLNLVILILAGLLYICS
jgi:hypothetical protein